MMDFLQNTILSPSRVTYLLRKLFIKNQNDILEIDESQFDSEFLNKSRKSIDQFEFNENKSIRSLSLISYTKVDIDVVIPPPDCIS